MRRFVGSHNFLAAPSRSLVLQSNHSVVHDLGVYIDGDLGAATHLRRTVSRCFAALRFATASSSTLPRYQRLPSFSRGLTRPLYARLVI